MKRGKEIKVNDKKDYKISFGTINTDNSKPIYIKFSSWALTLLEDEDIDYGKIISGIRKAIKQAIHNLKDCHFDCDTILVDFDMRESGIRYGMVSFMSCEITLYQQKVLPITDDTLKTKTLNVINAVDGVLTKTPYFKFHLGKFID